MGWGGPSPRQIDRRVSHGIEEGKEKVFRRLGTKLCFGGGGGSEEEDGEGGKSGSSNNQNRRPSAKEEEGGGKRKSLGLRYRNKTASPHPLWGEEGVSRETTLVTSVLVGFFRSFLAYVPSGGTKVG